MDEVTISSHDYKDRSNSKGGVPMFYRILVLAAVLGLLGAALTAGPALAGKGGNGKGGGHNTATIAFAAGDPVTFAVTANVKERELYSLWVANKCSQDGVVVYVQHQPVYFGLAGPFTLNWTGGGAAECTAYVWMFPDSERALRGGSMAYSVAP